MKLLLGIFLSIIVIHTSQADRLPGNYDKGGPGISISLINKCPLSPRFDFPVGRPNAKGYYNAQIFGKNDHLGDDWNGVGGGNSDLNDPVYSIADGIVVHIKDHKGGWGNVIRVLHNKGSRKNPVYIEALYGHVRNTYVKPGQIIKRGQKIATIGTANGKYKAHLHLEIRSIINMPLGHGYSKNTRGFLDPTRFIRENRK
jgi:hypothetical protein